MAYNPNLPQGPATSVNSAPVVVASDQSPLPTDVNTANQLDEIRTALMVLASTKGILADLRVTPTGTVTVSVSNTPAVTVSSGTVTTVSNLSQVGGTNANSVVQDWENQTYTSSFSANITRP